MLCPYVFCAFVVFSDGFCTATTEMSAEFPGWAQKGLLRIGDFKIVQIFQIFQISSDFVPSGGRRRAFRGVGVDAYWSGPPAAAVFFLGVKSGIPPRRPLPGGGWY